MTTLVELLHAAPAHGTAIVLPEAGIQLNYAQLREQVAIMADGLAALGIGPGDRVAIALPNGLPAIVCFLAASMAGTAAPLNPGYRQEEFSFFLADTSAKILLCPPDGAEAARKAAQGKLAVHSVEMDTSGRVRLAGAPHGRKSPSPSPDDVALVLHTSGSTGRPKRVPIRHRNIAASARNIVDHYALCHQDVSLCAMPLFHVHGLVASTIATLLSGGTIVVPSNFRPDLFWKTVRDCRVTWYSAVPTIHQLLLVQAGNERPAGSEGLRFIRSCSSALSAEMMTKMERVFGVPVLEAYGMTEASHQMCSNPLPPGVRRPGSVGPGTGVRVSILDDLGNHLDCGERGEVVIQGANVIDGYENPDGNAQAFAEGWFRTGDQGFLDENGYLTLTGRIKDLINRGGEKIAPREIDELLAAHPGVAEAVAFGVPHQSLGEEVAAAVVLREPHSEAAILSFCREHLADFKCPKKVFIVKSIPRTATGKIQRSAVAKELTSLVPEFTTHKASWRAPRTREEEVLCELFAEVLGLEQAGIGDDFFELGGHSLIAAQLASRVRARLGLELSMETVLNCRNVDQLAAHLRVGGPSGILAEQPSIQRVSRDQAIPLSVGQHRLWYLQKLAPGSSEYNGSTVRLLSGPLDFRALEQSINEIVRRHEILRTRFPVDARGEPVQSIDPCHSVAIARMGLETLPEEQQATEVRRLVAAEHERPFDLENGPLPRVTLLRLGSDQHVLILTLHHIVTDGPSNTILQRELSVLYQSFAASQPSPLSELPFQYADYAVWQRRRQTEGPEAKRTIDYWQHQLAGLPPPLRLSTATRQPKQKSFDRATRRFHVAEELTQGLKQLSQRCGSTLFMTLLSAFQVLLFRYSGETDLVVCSPQADRGQPGTESLIGFLVNILILRADLSGNPSFTGLLGRVRQRTLETYRHPYVPYEQLARMLPVDRHLRESPWFELMLNRPELEMPGLVTRLVPGFEDLAGAGITMDLELSMLECDSGLAGIFSYNAILFDHATVARMSGHFRNLLESIVVNPEESIAKLPLLTLKEQNELLGTHTSTN